MIDLGCQGRRLGLIIAPHKELIAIRQSSDSGIPARVIHPRRRRAQRICRRGEEIDETSPKVAHAIDRHIAAGDQ